MAWTVMKWAWRVAENIFYVLVVWYVLSHLRGHPENVIVPVLGLIYVMLRTLGINLGQITLQNALVLDSVQQQLRAISDVHYQRDRYEIREIERMKVRLTGDMLIESLSICIIFLLCIWYLFSAL
jgi:hypothetical protein